MSEHIRELISQHITYCTAIDDGYVTIFLIQLYLDNRTTENKIDIKIPVCPKVFLCIIWSHARIFPRVEQHTHSDHWDTLAPDLVTTHTQYILRSSNLPTLLSNGHSSHSHQLTNAIQVLTIFYPVLFLTLI